MKVTKEIYDAYSVRHMVWSGAKDTVEYLTNGEIETILAILEDTYPDGMSETELNEFFWFEDDIIAEWLGFDSFEDIINREE